MGGNFKDYRQTPEKSANEEYREHSGPAMSLPLGLPGKLFPFSNHAASRSQGCGLIFFISFSRYKICATIYLIEWIS